MVTVIDVPFPQGDRADPDRGGARGHGGEPGREGDRQHLRDHQHGALHRLRHRTRWSPTCWSIRVRASPIFKHDGSEVWVSSEEGGTVSVIDAATHKVKTKIGFDIQGMRADAIQPVGIRFTKDDKTAFVALGPANRVAVIDAQTYKVEKYLLVGQRVWQMAFTPDGKYLLTTNGLSNDVSVIDVAAQKVVKSIPVGRLPWGVVVAPR